jgi:hypothetical protein
MWKARYHSRHSSAILGNLTPSRGRPASTRKIVAASAFGTIIEWYDFFIYGTAAALVFGRLFFPSSDSTVSTLAALSVASSLVMPAHAGDRGAVRHSCFSILRIVARPGSQCSSERDQNWSLGTN